MKTKEKLIKLFFIALALFFITTPVLAESPLADIPCFKTGQICLDNPKACECGLCDVLYGFLKLAYWGLGIMGSLALLAFIVGGLYWFTAAGDKNKIAKGKSILTGTVMGIIIILSAFLIINFVISALTGQWGKFYIQQGNLKNWYDVCNLKVQK